MLVVGALQSAGMATVAVGKRESILLLLQNAWWYFAMFMAEKGRFGNPLGFRGKA